MFSMLSHQTKMPIKTINLQSAQHTLFNKNFQFLTCCYNTELIYFVLHIMAQIVPCPLILNVA